MFNAELYNDFCFLKVNFTKYHYTDNRKGSPYHYFAYLEKGRAKIVSKGAVLTVNEGELFYIPKNLEYQSYWYGNKEEVSLLSYGCNNLLATDTNFLALQVIKCPKDIQVGLSSIPTSGTKICIKDVAAFFNSVAALLPYMVQTPVSAAKAALLSAKKQLRSNPYCSNKELAVKCNISLPYLYKIFKAYENTSPNLYRQKVLCDKAKELLATTDIPIEKIGNILEFSSSGYFREIFKKHTGMTPRDFRKQSDF